MNHLRCLDVRYVLVVTALVLLASCSDGTTTGPAPLRDAAHMKQYLGIGEWRLVGPDTDRFFRFTSDGWFSAGGEGMAELLGFASATTLMMGKWDADMERLHLTEIVAGGSGGAAGAGSGARSGLSKTLPLEWADGKLNIIIAGENYRK